MVIGNPVMLKPMAPANIATDKPIRENVPTFSSRSAKGSRLRSVMVSSISGVLPCSSKTSPTQKTTSLSCLRMGLF